MTPTLSALGNACQVDRVYIFENHLAPDIGVMLTSQCFEWTNPIVEAQIDNSKRQNLSYASILPDWDENLADGKPIGGIVRDLPQFPIRSTLLLVELSMGHRHLGFVILFVKPQVIIVVWCTPLTLEGRTQTHRIDVHFQTFSLELVGITLM